MVDANKLPPMLPKKSLNSAPVYPMMAAMSIFSRMRILTRSMGFRQKIVTDMVFNMQKIIY